MSRFEKTDTVRYELPGMQDKPVDQRDFVMIRRRLSGAEKRRMASSGFRNLSGDEVDDTKVGIDFAALGLARVYAYVKDWGGPGFMLDGKSVECNREAIDALDEETLASIVKIIDEHVAKISAESKARSGEPTSSPDSASVGTSVGLGTSTNPSPTT